MSILLRRLVTLSASLCLATSALAHSSAKPMNLMLPDPAGGQSDVIARIVQRPLGKALGTLASAGKVEAPFLKQYPSVNDGKSSKGFAFNIWTGDFVKKDTPEPVVQARHRALSKVLADPAVHAHLAQQAVMPARPLSLAEASAEYAAQTARRRAITKAIQLEVQ